MENNEEENMERGGGIRLEQHIGTLLQIMVVALLAWSLSTTQNLTGDMAVLKVKVESLTTALNQGTNDRYRGTDAAKDFAAVRSELAYLERRIAVLEQKK
jgi:hypothetical protein